MNSFLEMIVDHPANMDLSERMQVLERQNNPAQGKILCPFGCDHRRCNEQGYCHHLIGWTENGKQMEVRERTDEQGRERCGNYVGKVLSTDVIVSGTPKRKNSAKRNCPTRSHRVYRKNGKAPYREPEKFGFTKHVPAPEWGFNDEDDYDDAEGAMEDMEQAV